MLEKVAEVSRHGMHPPIAGNRKETEAASGRPWASWLTADGQLTGHGYITARLKGQYEAESDRPYGFPGAGCPNTKEVSVWSSALKRILATAEALTDAAFPGCVITVHHPAEHNDPLFQNFSSGFFDRPTPQSINVSGVSPTAS